MIRTKIAHFIFSLALLVSGGLTFAPALAHADTQFKSDACDGVSQVTGTGGCDKSAGSAINNIISAVIQILSFVVGAAAVIMIIVGGFKFITAGGDSSAVASARTTILYSLVGLIIAIVAQVLVHFVIHKVAS